MDNQCIHRNGLKFVEAAIRILDDCLTGPATEKLVLSSQHAVPPISCFYACRDRANFDLLHALFV